MGKLQGVYKTTWLVKATPAPKPAELQALQKMYGATELTDATKLEVCSKLCFCIYRSLEWQASRRKAG